MSKLATQLKLLLIEKRMRPTQLAKATGIAQPIIHRLLTGKTTNPQLATLLTLAEYFNIELDQLIGRKETLATIHGGGPQLVLPTIPLISFEWFREDPIRTIESIDKALPKSSFAIRIEDERFAPFAHTGFYVVIDPQLQHHNLDYVLMQQAKHNTLSFRQLIIDGNTHYLRPISPQLPSRMLSHTDHVFGTITHVIHSRDQKSNNRKEIKNVETEKLEG